MCFMHFCLSSWAFFTIQKVKASVSLSAIIMCFQLRLWTASLCPCSLSRPTHGPEAPGNLRKEGKGADKTEGWSHLVKEWQFGGFLWSSFKRRWPSESRWLTCSWILSGRGTWGWPSLLISAQMSNVTPEHCLDIINKFEVSEENKQNEVLGIEGENYVFMVSLLFFLPIFLRLVPDRMTEKLESNYSWSCVYKKKN